MSKPKEIETKVCRTCGRELPVEEFGFTNAKKTCRRLDCRECEAAARKRKKEPAPWELVY